MFYSRRQLSYENDKLNALTGLAKVIGSKTNDIYIFGMWQEDLRAQLMWEVEKPSKMPKQNPAPSWSWASVDGSIKFNDWPPGTKWCFEILNVRLFRKDDELEGLRGAELVVKGPLKLYNEHQWQLATPPPTYPVELASKLTDVEWDRDKDLYVLKVGRTEGNRCLVLQKSIEEKKFLRKGFLDTHTGSTYFNDVEPTILTLI